MKRSIYMMMVLAVMMGLTACGKPKKSERINSGRCSRGGCANGNNDGGKADTESTEPSSGETLWGQIHKGNATQEQFYDGVEGLVSASINSFDDPSELGYVSGDMNDSTGIWFWGDVNTKGGAKFNANSPQNIQLNLADAELRIVVWDEYAGKADKNGNVIPEYPIHIRGATRGSVNGNTVVIRFEDDYGYVELVGTYDKDTFSGTVDFKNTTFWDGELHGGYKGAAGRVGYFTVPTCGFFHCQ